MNLEHLIKLAESLKKFGLGFSVGVALAIFIQAFVVNVLKKELPIDSTSLIFICGTITSMISNLIDKIIYRGLLKPVIDFIKFYTTIGHVFLLKKMGVISKEKMESLVEGQVNNYFNPKNYLNLPAEKELLLLPQPREDSREAIKLLEEPESQAGENE